MCNYKVHEPSFTTSTSAEGYLSGVNRELFLYTVYTPVNYKHILRWVVSLHESGPTVLLCVVATPLDHSSGKPTFDLLSFS